MHLGPAEPSGHVADDVTAGTVSADTKFASVIVDGNCDGVFTVDRARIITSFNRAGAATTGFTAREAVGRRGFEIFRTEVCHKRRGSQPVSFHTALASLARQRASTAEREGKGG